MFQLTFIHDSFERYTKMSCWTLENEENAFTERTWQEWQDCFIIITGPGNIVDHTDTMCVKPLNSHYQPKYSGLYCLDLTWTLSWGFRLIVLEGGGRWEGGGAAGEDHAEPRRHQPGVRLCHEWVSVVERPAPGPQLIHRGQRTDRLLLASNWRICDTS